jgi:glycosyltransferase involved in cell wall biosynthesis
LDIVGIFDEIFSPGYSEEVDFSQRALAMGFVHVCADDVFVFHEGGSSFGRSDKLKALILEHDELVRQRYPYYFHWVRATEKDPGSPLAATLLVADAALRGIRLVVDGSNLGPTNMGTQTVTLESVKALTRHAAIAEVTVLVPESAPASALAELGQCGAKVLVSGGRTRSWQRRLNADIVYRPSQVTRVSELERLLAMARRLVIWQLDCIAYNNPAYFVDWSRWAIYRRANQLAFRLADGIAFLSQTSFRDARTSGLVASGRTAVVYPGTNTERTLSEPKAPPGISGSESGFFLCLGVSYKHKNRVAAMRIWQEARAQGWEGGLVLAGPSPPQGDSLADEDEFLLAHPELKSSVWRLDVLSSDEKEWLYERAALVLYPSIVEGFGLVPFEAAARNVPCLSTRGGALDEVLPTDIPTINLEDVAATASCALELASDGPLRKALCGSLKARAVDFTWDRTADSLVNFFWAVMSQPSQERDRVAELSSKTVARAGLGARSWVFTKTYPLVSWGIAQVVERPRLRRFLLPRGSLRFRLGRAIVRSVDRKTR